MITEKEYQALATKFKLPISSVKAIDEVESSGRGFCPTTKRIMIQFEPHWFKRFTRLTKGLWVSNKVDVQSREWQAFNNAFSLNPEKAMKSTSIGRMQVMGFHYKRLGFKTVGAMWDYAKKCEANQLWLGLKFIQTDKRLYTALLAKDWKTVARLYNGQNYYIKGYHTKLKNAELKHRK